MTETIPQPPIAAADQTEHAAAPESAKPGLLVLAPLRVEANAVRRGRPIAMVESQSNKSHRNHRVYPCHTVAGGQGLGRALYQQW